VLSLLDLVWAQYGWSREAAIYDTPLCQLFLAYRQRAVVWEVKTMPSLSEQDDLMRNKAAYLEVLKNGC
jgi:hypothetical protein